MRRKDIEHIRKLKPDEKALWHKVKRTIEPMHQRMDDFSEIFEVTENVAHKTKSVPAKTSGIKPVEMPSWSPSANKRISAPIGQSHIDDTTARKLSKGRIAIDATIDLHGMSQAHAHSTLLRFISNAHASSCRMVLVITGKGRISGGILRSQVPLWLKQGDFSACVSGFRQAAIAHGGEGALYVRIRKNRESA